VLASQPLSKGKTYRLYVLRDVGVSLANCLFEYGSAAVAASADDAGVAAAAADAGATQSGASGAACASVGGDAGGFGAPCKDGVNHSDCPCAANYCAVMPGQSMGYCTSSGCNEPGASCPDGFSCFDLSRFAPDQPAICTR
jgi:hypothetical protein